MSDVFASNPFDQPYLTESLSDPSELLAHYSFLPFKYVKSQVDRPGNIFLLGRRGVGKTMILKFFDAEIVAEVFRSNSALEPRKHTLVGGIGTYVNLANPLIRIRDFAGKRGEEDWWCDAFSDHFNCYVLAALVANLRVLSASPEWRNASHWNGPPFQEDTALITSILNQLRMQSSAFDEVEDFDSLVSAIHARQKHWLHFLNREISNPPTAPLRLASPLFHIAQALRARYPKFRIVLLVDQYEALHGHRGRDLRLLFNEAMSQAARGSTGVEFKIGCRPYAQGRLSMPDGSGRIEAGREFDLVDLDRFAATYFAKFAAELLDRRVMNARDGANRMLAASRVTFIPGYEPREEAERYERKAREESTRHLAPFREKWRSYDLDEHAIESTISKIFDDGKNVLVDVLTAMALTRWLDREGDTIPDWVPKKHRGKTKEEHLVAYGAALRAALLQRYERGMSVARKSGSALRAADDEVSAWEQSALFRIASAFKNQRKYYSGFDSLVRVSSNVALVFIQIMRKAWDLQALNGGDPRETIRPEIQSEAVYAVSEAWFASIEREYEHGIIQASFVRNLGAALKTIQMDPAATIPTPNGFSIAPIVAGTTDASEEFDRKPPDDAASFLHLLVSWGLLEPTEHQDKTRGRPRRTKYYFNRILCPYLGLSELRIKDPVYVDNIETFIALLQSGKIPSELLRARGTAARSPQQRRLV
jgi:hypothetical protein